MVWTLSRPYNGGVLSCSKAGFVISFMYIFATYSTIGVIFSAKLAQKRQFCARARTNAHAATRKSAWKRCFDPHNGLFLPLFAICALTFYIYSRRSAIWCIGIMGLRSKIPRILWKCRVWTCGRIRCFVLSRVRHGYRTHSN